MSEISKNKTPEKMPFIKIIISQSQLFKKDKNILPYTLSLQLDDFPEKKIQSINNAIQILESPSNEFFFEINLHQKDSKEEIIEHILTLNAYTTSIFFIQKKIAYIKIPIFTIKKINSKQWYILKDSNEEACIKLLIEIEVNIYNELYNKINKEIYNKNNNYNSNSQPKNSFVVRKNSISKKNIINHNNNYSNCYTHLSTNFHSINSNSLIKINDSNHNSNIILINNKSTPMIFNPNTNNYNTSNSNNLSNNYSNMSYILGDKISKEKEYESSTPIYNNNNNDNFFCELEIPLESEEKKNSLVDHLNNINNIINLKKKYIQKKKEILETKKNEVINFEKKFFIKKKKFEKDLIELNHNERIFEKEKQIYENKIFDLNDNLLQKKYNDYKSQLSNDIFDYEKNIINDINNKELNNNNINNTYNIYSNNDNLLYGMNDRDRGGGGLEIGGCLLKNNNIILNNKKKDNLFNNFNQYISGSINNKEKKYSFNNNSNSQNNSHNGNSNLNLNDKIISASINKKKFIKKNTEIKFDNSKRYKKLNNPNNFNNKNLLYKKEKEIKTEKINNYLPNKISLKKKNNILNDITTYKISNTSNKIKLNKIFKSNPYNSINNFSYFNKNSIFNNSLSKKKMLINNTKSYLQKNYSLSTIRNKTKNYILNNTNYNTYKNKSKKYPIKLNYIKDEIYDNNNICITEPSIRKEKQYMNRNVDEYKLKKNKMINSYSNYNYTNKDCPNNSTSCYNIHITYTNNNMKHKNKKMYRTNKTNNIKKNNNKINSTNI